MKIVLNSQYLRSILTQFIKMRVAKFLINEHHHCRYMLIKVEQIYGGRLVCLVFR